jgi:hypothetical protein
VGDGELRIVASQDIGQLGPKDGSPVLFHWRWYYHFPTAPLWALIVLLLIAPKANRHRQAWLILIPLALVLLVWHMPTVLLGMSDGSAEILGCLIVSFAMAWAAVWLLGHRLGSRRRTTTFFLILAVMLAVGVLSIFCLGDMDDPSMPLVAYATYLGFAVVCFLVAMMLSSRFCRKRFSPRRFGLWLLVWLGALCVGLALLVYLVANTMARQPVGGFLEGLIVIPMMAAILAGIVYLVNLPFLILSLKNPFYRRRLEAMFRVGPDGGTASLQPCVEGQPECNTNQLPGGPSS